MPIRSAALVLCFAACGPQELDAPPSIDDTHQAQDALSSSTLVLTANACVKYGALSSAVQADVTKVGRYLAMTPDQRRAAGVVTSPTLSPAEVRDLTALQTKPCQTAAGDWSCVSGGEGWSRWVMCTNGDYTCGASTTGAPWCR